MAEENKPTKTHVGKGAWVAELLGGGAAGVGVVLVLLPAVAMVANVAWFDKNKVVGLPVLAILGIMILLGTLALVAMLFQRLGLTDRAQPLALPTGSMRAAIALSLVVLFAIISITLYLSISDGGQPYRITGLREAERNALVTAAQSRVVQVYDECVNAPPAAAASAAEGAADRAAGAAVASAPCAEADRRYAVVLQAGHPADAVDLAKQLLVLVGTLMTSVTSYYFAARAGAESDKSGNTNPAAPNPSVPRDATSPEGGGGAGSAMVAKRQADSAVPADAAPAPPASSQVGSPTAAAAGATVLAEAAHGHPADDADGCDVEMLDATPDDQLPVASGGVAAPKEAA
jgi:hypothetical protein